jgi:uroporphyrinogen decarboxylase
MTTRPVVEALRLRPLPVPPVWLMRQAGRHLPEYRELRSRHSFQEAVSTPAVAAELTLQPVRRYGVDGAVIFADIMTPLEAMGVEMTFDPGPRLKPHTLDEVIGLGALDPERVGFVAETIAQVRAGLADEVAIIGFAGAPATLLAYLLEGGGSKDFMAVRAASRRDAAGVGEALGALSEAMRSYLALQVEAGADVVQLFDSWAGMFDRDRLADMVIPAAAASLHSLEAPTIYFAPGCSHGLDLLASAGADGYGLDWRIPIDEAWSRLGAVAVQGNLDPSVLLADPSVIRAGVGDLLGRVAGRPGHIVNLGHGVHQSTPPEHVAAFVDAVRGWQA